VKYMLRIILATYRDFEERVDLVSEKLPAKEIVRRAVYSKMGKLSKSDYKAKVTVQTLSIHSFRFEKQFYRIWSVRLR
ncbi:MAG: hypothetical protein PUC12_09195, partial [Clostridiales bacterium]|nr:hypothetical protein [Clostridiales bacterium]